MGRVFVAGSINMDVVATAERHPQVGETVAGKEVLYFPGGKGANQAVAAARLEVPTTLIGRLGTDAFGAELRSFLEAQAVDVSLVVETANVHTGTAIITLANADNTIVVIPGANGLVSADDTGNAPLAPGDVAVSQFEIPLPAITTFFRRARTVGALTILNPAPARACEAELLDLVDILVLNETELGLLANIRLREDAEIPEIVNAAKALDKGPTKVICVTLGRRGVLALAGDDHHFIAGHKVTAVDTTGAGDCFVGALAAQLASEATLHDALVYANTAASICVQRMGAAPSMPDPTEVSEALCPNGKTSYDE
jgi:ribokinase